MKCVELNRIGDYNHWEISKLEELKKNLVSNFLEDELIFENDLANVWELKLEPQERLPFKRINTNYYFVALINILAITRCSNAAIRLINLNKGKSYSIESKNENMIYDIENIGNKTLHMYVVELK